MTKVLSLFNSNSRRGLSCFCNCVSFSFLTELFCRRTLMYGGNLLSGYLRVCNLEEWNWTQQTKMGLIVEKNQTYSNSLAKWQIIGKENHVYILVRRTSPPSLYSWEAGHGITILRHYKVIGRNRSSIDSCLETVKLLSLKALWEIRNIFAIGV